MSVHEYQPLANQVIILLSKFRKSVAAMGLSAATLLFAASPVSAGSYGSDPYFNEVAQQAQISAAEQKGMQTKSALGETNGPGPSGIASRVFIYVKGKGLRADYAQVGWRGAPWDVTYGNVCGGKFDVKWTNANGVVKTKSGSTSKCTNVAQYNWPGHYISFNMKHESFAPNSKTCGRYHIDGKTSTWACIVMKP